MKLKFLIPLIAFAAMALLLFIGLGLNPKVLPSTYINKAAPPIVLNNAAEHTNSAFNSEDLLGQPWVLNVWASWCVSCRYEHPLFNKLASLNLAPIVGLNYKDEKSDAQQWLAQRGNPYYATPHDLDGRVGIEWGVVAVPETFVIDAQGQVVYKHTGPVDAQRMDQEIVPLIKALLADS